MSKLILVINPGSTSTKVALFDGEVCQAEQVCRHQAEQLAKFDNVADQFEFRLAEINAWLESIKFSSESLVAVVGRGAPLRPLEGGAYAISDQMIDDLRGRVYSNHASNLGPIMARHFAEKFDVPSLISDPITVDNFTDIARLSGLPQIERKCRSHALNIKEVSRREAARVNRKLNELNFVTVHMGGGISVAALAGGRIVDVNDGLLGMGPFSPDRAGALPVGGVVKLCFSGDYTEKELTDILSKKSGLMAYLGEADLREVEKMIANGDDKAKLCFDAMAYQISKEIGAMATVLNGELEAVILTGGMARSESLVKQISNHVKFIARVAVVPGEFEMEALAAAGVRYLEGSEKLKEY